MWKLNNLFFALLLSQLDLCQIVSLIKTASKYSKTRSGLNLDRTKSELIIASELRKADTE